LAEQSTFDAGSGGMAAGGVRAFARIILANLPAIALVAVLLLSFIGLSPVAVIGDPAPGSAVLQSGEGDTARQISFLLLFGIMAVYVTMTRGLRQLAAIPAALAVILGWCWLSVFWAVSPDIALRRIALTTIVVLIVRYCVASLSYKAVLSLLFGTFAAILLLDWAAIPLLPNAIHQSNEAINGIGDNLIGNWRGLQSHKNEAGAFCAMACMVFGYVSFRSRSLIVGPLLVALSLLFLYMTQSKTSGGFVFVAMLAGVVVCASYKRPVVRGIILFLAAMAVPVAVLLLPNTIDTALYTFDDPGAFTGRAQIWPVLLAYASDHLMLGAGYGSFWSVGDASPVFNYTSGWILTIDHAHNGYLDLLVQIGLIGLVLTVGGLVVYPLYVLLFRPLGNGASRWLLASLVVFGCLHDLLETSLLERANPVWVAMVIVYCLLFDAAKPAQALPARKMKLLT
jgi:hypothetical protein